MTEDSAATLVAQLRVLAHLTRTEAQSARLRVPQAADGAAAEALRRSADDADTRSARIAAALHDLDAPPDPVTPVLGPVAALVRGVLEQAQPLDETLLGDLALTHQQAERARYAAALADGAGLPAVRALADDLAAVHTAAATRLGAVLAAAAAGEPTGLVASPLQRLAAQVARVANVPGRAAAAPPAAPEPPATSEPGSCRPPTARADLPRSAPTTEALHEPVPGPTPDPAPTPDTAPVPESAPPAPGASPVPGFAELPARAAIAALRTLDDPAQVAAVLAVEQARGDRPAVVAAARVWAAALTPRDAPTPSG